MFQLLIYLIQECTKICINKDKSFGTLAKYPSVVMSYANLSPDWQDSVNAAARETETKTGADAALTMRAYSLPCTWEH